MGERMFESLSKKNKELDESIWISEPPTLDVFCTSPEYLGGPPLSPIQRRDALALLGDDPKKVFDGGSQYTIGVFLWGKGSGKDWLVAILQAYVLELLCCLRNPQKFFKSAPNEPIDTVNISVSHTHAVEIYFLKLRNMVLMNKKMRDRYSIFDGNQLLKIDGNVPGRPRMEFRTGEILLTDCNVRARSFGCDHDSVEGRNVVFWCMDEASAFSEHTQLGNANKIYSTLRTSAMSRFPGKWKGLVISYPRSEDDFTVKLLQASKRLDKREGGDTIYGSRHATWEVRPLGSFSAETFKFEGLDIPVDFQDEFEKYPEESLAKYACRPPVVDSPFISYRHRIDECIIPNRSPLIVVQDSEIELTVGDGIEEFDTRHYIGKRIDSILDKSPAAKRLSRVIHVDGGLVNDCAVMIMAHGVPTEITLRDNFGKMSSVRVNKVVVDAIVVWKPNKKKDLQVSFNNIETLILELKTAFNITRVSYDQWNSQSSLETLQAHGIRAEEHTIDTDDYRQLRTMIYSRAVELPSTSYKIGDDEYKNDDAELLAEELKKLKWINNRVDHPKNFSKDAADCLAGVNRLLNDPNEMRLSMGGGLPKAISGPSISVGQSGPLSPESMGLKGSDLLSPPGHEGKRPQMGGRPAQMGLSSQILKNGPIPGRSPSQFPRGILSKEGPGTPRLGRKNDMGGRLNGW